MIHRFRHPVDPQSLPVRFTNPFGYTPHPLCEEAARELQAYLSGQEAWRCELERGKMFGVLVVRDRCGEIGFLAAFSGNLAATNRHPFFVPPVFDMLRPDGFFREGEREIAALGARIAARESDESYREALRRCSDLRARARAELGRTAVALKAAKADRDRLRQAGTTEAEEALLVARSRFEKAEYKRLRRRWDDRIAAAEAAVARWTGPIERLKEERKRRSAALQQRLFDHFRFLNAEGDERSLTEIFARTPFGRPPAGAGECAAPKLLQYAYVHHLTPVAMAEFWWGASPGAELRRHGYYYPACRSKCGPILEHMLRGLPVDDPVPRPARTEPRVVWEDRWIVAVDKPAGLLSVPGRSDAPSVWKWAAERYPEATGPLVVHRLDMGASGLLLIAKEKSVHQRLQAQFARRTIVKRYVALLDAEVRTDEGRIELPLRSDPEDRPRQRVDRSCGKPAVTEYRVLGRCGGRTRIEFRPSTGRTHQLRVHAAHPDGLDAPMVGDTLYGHPDRRLFLHAESLEFRHPVSGEIVRLEAPAPF